MKHKRTINTEAVVGNVSPSLLDRITNRKKSPKYTEKFVFNLPKVTKKIVITKKYILVIIFIVGTVGIYSGIKMYLSQKSPIESPPIPGQPVGPPPIPTKIEDAGPRDNIQILPDGDGPTSPNGPSKPAVAG